MADQKTRKHVTFRKASVSLGMNPMEMSSDHDMHETECMLTEDTILQRQAWVGNTKITSKIHKSKPLSNVYMKLQAGNDSQYINLVGNST